MRPSLLSYVEIQPRKIQNQHRSFWIIASFFFLLTSSAARHVKWDLSYPTRDWNPTPCTGRRGALTTAPPGNSMNHRIFIASFPHEYCQHISLLMVHSSLPWWCEENIPVLKFQAPNPPKWALIMKFILIMKLKRLTDAGNSHGQQNACSWVLSPRARRVTWDCPELREGKKRNWLCGLPPGSPRDQDSGRWKSDGEKTSFQKICFKMKGKQGT